MFCRIARACPSHGRVFFFFCLVRKVMHKYCDCRPKFTFSLNHEHWTFSSIVAYLDENGIQLDLLIPWTLTITNYTNVDSVVYSHFTTSMHIGSYYCASFIIKCSKLCSWSSGIFQLDFMPCCFPCYVFFLFCLMCTLCIYLKVKPSFWFSVHFPTVSVQHFILIAIFIKRKRICWMKNSCHYYMDEFSVCSRMKTSSQL